ncbi:hypothetical protein BH11PLA2_BH11PLA2_21780 [soil metagenome]
MNTLTRSLFKSLPVVGALPERTVGRVRPTKRVVRAKRAVITFLATLFGINVLLGVGMDTFSPRLRDAEYVERRQRAEVRQAIAGNRPYLVALGSSRVSFGVRPLVVDGADQPAIANMSLVGSGPILQLLALQRLLRDGVTPDTLLVEYWPPFLNSRGSYSEFVRIDPHRFFVSDEAFVRESMPNPDGVMSLMREIRRTPVWCHRLRLMSHLLPTWLPFEKRFDPYWTKIDAAGWLPGVETLTAAERVARVKQAGDYYKPLFANYAIAPEAEKAYREILSLAKAKNIHVVFVWLPESSEFRGWYPPEVTAANDAFRKQFKVKWVNARDWLPDEMLGDGYHLTTAGATAFTQRLMSELK